MKSLLQQIKNLLVFTPLEWFMILLSSLGVILDIVTALLIADGNIAGYLLLPLSVLLTALAQGVWIKCLRNMTSKQKLN